MHLSFLKDHRRSAKSGKAQGVYQNSRPCGGPSKPQILTSLDWRVYIYICIYMYFFGGGCFFVFQPGFLAFVAFVAFVGWAFVALHSLLVYLSI